MRQNALSSPTQPFTLLRDAPITGVQDRPPNQWKKHDIGVVHAPPSTPPPESCRSTSVMPASRKITQVHFGFDSETFSLLLSPAPIHIHHHPSLQHPQTRPSHSGAPLRDWPPIAQQNARVAASPGVDIRWNLHRTSSQRQPAMI